jgi:RES domain-containing protein
MKLWRIAAETRSYPADDLSGNGAAKSPGRWNDDKQPVVYCAPSIAVAVLETAAHIDDGGLPLNRFLVCIDVPDEVWALREQFDVAQLPPAWAAIPAGRTSVQLGSDWLASGRAPILLVPSVVVPEEWAALLNPSHRLAALVSAQVVRPFEYNKLLGR